VKKLILVSCLALAGFSMSASAAELSGGFIRGELGNSDVDVGGDSDSDNTWGVGGGWWFNKNFAVEGSWNSLYDEDGVSLDGFGLGLVGKTTVADGKGFYADGRIGMFRAKGEVDGFGSDTSTDLYFGVGVGYDFNQNVGVGLNYTRYNGDFDGLDADTSTLTGSLEFRF
jgi:OOP family OmpA-OmpF porin/outer membrane immunogenic protein